MVQGHDLEFDDSASCVDWDMRGIQNTNPPSDLQSEAQESRRS